MTSRQDEPAEAAHRPADLEEVQRIAGLGFWKWDLATGEVRCSREFFRIRGLEVSTEPLARPALTRFAHPEDRAAFDQAIEEAVRTGDFFDFNYRIVRPDGDVRIVHTRGRVIEGPDGKATHMLGTSQDVTDAERNRTIADDAERLRQEAEFRADFISKAAHELRTPLLPIRVQTHILATALGTRPDPRQQKALDSLSRNLDRLNRLIDDLLEASRLQSGRLKLETVPFELSELVDEAIDNFRPVADQLGLLLLWRPRRGVVVEADPHRILQVLHNLLGNAMKFTPSGGTISVHVDREEKMARLTVSDTGAGLAPEELERLFQPFTQTGAGRESKAPGSGLGLYVAKGIVREHGGQVAAESGGRGKGATFKVELPISEKAAKPVTASTQAPQWWRDAAPSDRAARFRDLI